MFKILSAKCKATCGKKIWENQKWEFWSKNDQVFSQRKKKMKPFHDFYLLALYNKKKSKAIFSGWFCFLLDKAKLVAIKYF